MLLSIDEPSMSMLFEAVDGVLEPVGWGDSVGASLTGLGIFAEVGDIKEAFSSPVIASDIARRPVARDLVKRVRPGAAGEGRAWSMDDVSLLGKLGDPVAIASILGDLA